MRLMNKDIGRFTLLRGHPINAGYVGTKLDFTAVGLIDGVLSPASDKLSIELYGEKSASMYRFTVLSEVDLRQDDRISVDGTEYTVISIMRYSDHTDAMICKEEAYNGGD